MRVEIDGASVTRLRRSFGATGNIMRGTVRLELQVGEDTIVITDRPQQLDALAKVIFFAMKAPSEDWLDLPRLDLPEPRMDQ